MWPQALTPVRRQVLYEDMRRYAALTHDPNPIHLDHAYARNAPFGGVIAHGTFSLNLIWQAVRLSLGPLEKLRFSLDIRFLGPVREWDWISAGGAIEAQSGYEARYSVWVEKKANDRAIDGTLTVRLRRP